MHPLVEVRPTGRCCECTLSTVHVDLAGPIAAGFQPESYVREINTGLCLALGTQLASNQRVPAPIALGWLVCSSAARRHDGQRA